MIIIYSESGVSTEYHKRMNKIPPVKNQNIVFLPGVKIDRKILAFWPDFASEPIAFRHNAVHRYDKSHSQK